MTIVLFAIICAGLMLVALVDIVVPMIPGIPLAWLGLFIFAVGTGFSKVSVGAVIIFFVLVVLITLLDFLAPVLFAKKYQATKFGILGAFLGLLAGVIFLSFWGIIIGPFIGAFTLELIAMRKADIALKSAVGTFIGFLAGTLLKTILLLIMIGFFIVSLF